MAVSTGQTGPAGHLVADTIATSTATVTATAVASSQYVPERVRSFVHSACSAVRIPSLWGATRYLDLSLVAFARDDGGAAGSSCSSRFMRLSF